eukprot:s2840_g2.t1
MDSVTTKLSRELAENLRSKGILVATDQRLWRSMYANFGRQFPIMQTQRAGTLGKTAIWAVIEKNLFRQRVFLMCATNREHVSTLNERAYKPEESGIDPALLRNATGPTKTFAIAGGEMQDDDYAQTDATVFQKKDPTTTTRFTREKRQKDHYKKSAPTLSARKSVLLMAARLKVAFDKCGLQYVDISDNFQQWLVFAAASGLQYVDISDNFQQWLVFAAASVIANRNLPYGEELMKSISHMGGVRIPYQQARVHDLGIGLSDEMSWEVNLFKIHESLKIRPIDKFIDTLASVEDHLAHEVTDEGNLTIHIWLSLQFLHEERPPHDVILEATFTTMFVKAITDLDAKTSRPILSH